VGVVGASRMTRVMTSLLFGVSTTDAFTFGIVPALAGGGSVYRDRHSGVEGNSSRSDCSRCEKNSGPCPVYSFSVFPRCASDLIARRHTLLTALERTHWAHRLPRSISSRLHQTICQSQTA